MEADKDFASFRLEFDITMKNANEDEIGEDNTGRIY